MFFYLRCLNLFKTKIVWKKNGYKKKSYEFYEKILFRHVIHTFWRMPLVGQLVGWAVGLCHLLFFTYFAFLRFAETHYCPCPTTHYVMEAHFFVIINRLGKCHLCTIPLNANYDCTTVGLLLGLERGFSFW